MDNNKLGGKSIILRLEMNTHEVHFGQVASSIFEAGGDIVAIDVIQTSQNISVRDITITVTDTVDIGIITEMIKGLNGVRLVNISDRTFLLHLGGKIETKLKSPIQNRDDLSRVYTPDVARVCMAIHEEPRKAFTLTIKRNTVAVISDGSAVLGLGNIGPFAAMPVMEGKSMLFKQFADVDSFPICLDTQDTEQIIAAIKAIAPGFGGINLEDISSPRCFEIEQRLREELDIPVFHDDQHGTAVVLYAALINALKIVKKSIHEIKVVVCGIGAAGIACSKNFIIRGGHRHHWRRSARRTYCGNQLCTIRMWQWYAENTNPKRVPALTRSHSGS